VAAASTTRRRQGGSAWWDDAAPSGSALQLDLRAAPSVTAPDALVERSAVGRVQGRKVRLRHSGALAAIGRTVRVRQGGGLVLAGARLRVERGGGQWLVGGLIQAKQVYAVTVIAARVEGQVRCLFDVKSAFALGAGAALMTGLLRLLRKR
jgi:hypothetical protein